ncbi:MAG: chemotaxis protein CheD [Planctomycetota bacterium]
MAEKTDVTIRKQAQERTLKHIVGVADMKISRNGADVLVTHALGSCLGIVAHDLAASVGGLFHVMLPSASVNPPKAEKNPYMFVDTGLPQFFRELYAAGANKGRLVVKVAGGAQIRDKNDFFAIGKRNYVAMRKLFWKNGFMIAGEDVGGSVSRTMYLDVGSGRVWINSCGEEKGL